MYASQNFGKLLLRLNLGIFLFLHGIFKIQSGVDNIGMMLTSKGLPSFFAYGVYIGEIVAPLLLILGIFSRFCAFVILINMLFAIFLVHADDIFMIASHGGLKIEVVLFYISNALCIMLLGPGRYSLMR